MYEVKEEQSICGKTRQWVLHVPEAAAVPCEVTSLGDAATNLRNDARIREIFMDKGYSECDGVDSMSSGSMSSGLGDTWRQGLPVSPQWEGDFELEWNSESDTDNGCEEVVSCEASDSVAMSGHTDCISVVRERSL